MKKCCWIVIFIVSLWFVGLMFFDYKINHIAVDSHTKTDAIVVLTGGRHRLSEAIRLLNVGMSDKLFISGVSKNVSLEALEKHNGVSVAAEGHITLDKIATNTFENARETSLWIIQEKIKSIRLVTSNYHLYRSLVEFKRWNKQVKIVLHPVYSEKVATSWWKSVDSFVFLASEYNKFLFAFMRAMCFNV